MAELAPEPQPDQRWTSDQDLDRLAPLATSLHHWSPVYERWRGHESAAARPQQPCFDRADLSAIDDLRGVHFGRFAAASRRLRTAGAALTRIAESTTAAGSALADAWRDGAAQPAAHRLAEIQRGAQDCAALCERLGVHLQSALIDTVAAVISGAVDEILARSHRWEQTAARTSREFWEQRIAELDAAGPVPAGLAPEGSAPEGLAPEGLAPERPVARWQAELDALVVDYDAAIGLYRATLTAAANTVAQVYQALHREIGPWHGTLSGSAPGRVEEPVGDRGSAADPAAAGRTAQDAGAAPASTALAAADSGGADAPAAASSSVGGGGSDSGGSGGFGGSGGSGGSPDAGPGGAGTDGSALLGQLSDPPAAGSGGATLASASGDDPGYGAGAATAGAGGAGLAPMAGALGTGAADDQQRAGRPWVVAGSEDRAREASWARLRALLGEDAGERPEPGRAGR